MSTIKCVVVGDHDCGKTALIFSYTTGKYPLECVPTVTVEIGGEPYTIALFDTAGQENSMFRSWSYPQTDVFLVLFSVASPSSFENVKDIWVPDIKRLCPYTPFLVVGTEIERRTDPETLDQLERAGQSIVSPDEGRVLAMKVLAKKYLECFAMTQEGLKNVFVEALLAALEPRSK